MDRSEDKVAVFIGLQDPQVGDDAPRTPSAESELLAVPGVVPESDGGDEADAVDEYPPGLAHDDDHLTARGRDLWRAAGAGQPHLRVVVGADHSRVDVGAPVDLRRTEKSQFDASRLQPVVEDLRH